MEKIKTFFSFIRKSISINFYIFLIPLLIILYISIRDVSNNTSVLFNKLIEFIGIDINANILTTFLINSFILIIPFLVITVIEITNSKSSLYLTLSKVSIAQIKNSDDYDFADIWYFIFHLLKEEFTIFFTFFTLGLSSLSIHMETIFSKLYSTLIPSPQNEINTLFLLLFVSLIDDLLSYLEHRAQHSFPFLWDLHELHHSSKKMTIVSNFRATPLESIFISPLRIPISTLTALIVFDCLSKGYSLVYIFFIILSTLRISTMYLSHSSLKVIYPKPISFLFMSPALHWLHHSNNSNHYNCNYGMVFPFWDKLFSTYLDEKYISEISEFGVEGSTYNKHHPIYSYLVVPILKIKNRLNILSP